jgi:hypothetical protein
MVMVSDFPGGIPRKEERGWSLLWLSGKIDVFQRLHVYLETFQGCYSGPSLLST